ncbi:MAG: hypothetical protein D6767_06545 [Candidatus Hydrogenedentota bacterium]|nr:MAG: hypothetical protein D6767_06545 [Candidatus Hydrogenedentota bacterium]
MAETAKPDKCVNCGGSEFKLLPSGKYKCTYCGTEQLPKKIQVHQVSLENSLKGTGTTFKKLMIPAALILALVFFLAYFFHQSSKDKETAQQAIAALISAYANVKVQEDRSLQILQRYSSVLIKKYGISKKDIQEKNLQKIYDALLSQDLDETGMRIQDELNGALNRLTIAKRKYLQAYEMYKMHKTETTEKIVAEKIRASDLVLPEKNNKLIMGK